MQPAAQEGVSTAGFAFVMYLTDDLDRARTFYESLFGFTPGAFDTPYFVEYELSDGNAFALAKMPEGPRAPTGGAMFAVADAEAAITRVEALGGKVVARYGGDVCTTGWCTDSEGNPFGLHQSRQPPT